MAQYYYTGNFTYTNKTNRDSALSAINAELANYPTVTGVAIESLPAGVNTAGATGLTLSLLVPDEATAETFRHAMNPQWATGSRSTFVVACIRVSS